MDKFEEYLDSLDDCILIWTVDVDPKIIIMSSYLSH